MALVDTFIDYLSSQLGKPYEMGSSGPDSYDCSGLIYDACQQIYGQSVPRVSTDQYTIGKGFTQDDLQIGDIVFFDTGWTERVPNHNGVYIGDGKFINANSYNGEVVEDDINSSYWSGTYFGVKRFFDGDGNFITEDNLFFTDVSENDTNYEFIMDLKDQGIVSGDGGMTNGATTFRPNDALNRAEALKLILSYFSLANVSDDATLDFSDVPKDAWYYLYVKTGVQKGIIEGYTDGTFKPGNAVSRAESCKMILESTGDTISNPASIEFSDVEEGSWYAKYVIEAEKREMILSSGSMLYPHDSMTRGNICRALVKSNA